MAVTATRLYVLRSVSSVVVLDLTASSIEMGFLLARHRIAEVGDSAQRTYALCCCMCTCVMVPALHGRRGEQTGTKQTSAGNQRTRSTRTFQTSVLRPYTSRSPPLQAREQRYGTHKRPSNGVAACSGSQSTSRFRAPPDQAAHTGITRPANQRDIGGRVAYAPRGLCMQHHACHPGRCRRWRAIAIAGSQNVCARRHARMQRWWQGYTLQRLMVHSTLCTIYSLWLWAY